jgi:hypothetical protein
MSGAHVKWTPERRAQRAALMRAKWADPAYREQAARRNAETCRSPAARERSRRSMHALHERLRTDPLIESTWRTACWQANARPEKRAITSGVMKQVHARPERKAHIRTLAKRTWNKRLNDPRRRKIRGGVVPPYLEGTYRVLREKKRLSAREAYLAIKPHIRPEDRR